MSDDNKFDILSAPPPPLFAGQKERDLVKQVAEEYQDRIIGQQVILYPISLDNSNFHQLYNECIKKSFLPPIHCFATIEWQDNPSTTTNYGVDNTSEITVHFHKRRMNEDQDLVPKVGDMVAYGCNFYEIIQLWEPREMFGQTQYKVQISAKCIRARKDLFDSL